MPRFAYTARDSSGNPVAADLEAPSRKDALRLLAARGLRVASVAEAGRPGGGPSAARRPGLDLAFLHPKAAAPGRGERLHFLEALHDLTTSGLSAGEAVRLLSIRIKEPRLRALCAGLWERIGEGAPLSRAMAAFPEVFDASTLNLIHAGEATGSINDTLARQIDNLTEQRELRRQLLAALAYPVFMLFVASGLVLFFLFFLLPRLQGLLDEMHGTMPGATRLLIALSTFALHYGLFILAAAAFAAVSLWRWRATPAGRAATDAWLIRLPLVGPFVVSQTVFAFSRTLSVLLENGITASEALRLTERQIGNRVHRGLFNEAIARILEGEALSSALGRTGCLPDLVLDRLAVGENTGNVVPSLKDVARTYQKRISQQLNVGVKILVSAFLLGVFLFVGFIAFAIVMALFSASASFRLQG